MNLNLGSVVPLAMFDFRSNFEAAQPPILIDNGVAVLENEKIERHIMKNIPGGHNLFISDNVRSKQLYISSRM